MGGPKPGIMTDALSKELGLSHLPQSDANHDKELYASEKQYERPRPSSDSHALQRSTSGVNVEQAEKDFAELSRELSAISRHVSRTHSKGSNVRTKDVEKAISSSDDTSDDVFDLESTLRGARDADDAAGIKSKYIGELPRQHS